MLDLRSHLFSPPLDGVHGLFSEDLQLCASSLKISIVNVKCAFTQNETALFSVLSSSKGDTGISSELSVKHDCLGGDHLSAFS